MTDRSPSLEDVAQRRMAGLTVRLGLIVGIFTLVVASGFYAQGMLTRVRTLTDGISGYVEQLLAVQDLFELSRYLNSLTRADTFAAYSLQVADVSQPLLAGGRQPLIATGPSQSHLSPGLGLSFHAGYWAPRLVQSVVLSVPYQGKAVTLVVELQFPLFPPLAALVLGLGVLWFFHAVVQREAVRLARAVSSPIGRLAERIGAFDLGGRDLTDAEQPAAEFSEIHEVYGQFRRLRERLSASERREREQAELVAIGKTTQMLAHDVRKPFSLLKMGLDLLARESSPDRIRSVASTLVPQVDEAMQTVSGILQDVMDVGAPACLSLRAMSLPDLIVTGLRSSVQAGGHPGTELTYALEHAHLVMVDPSRIGRVFSNIIENALQANGWKGKVWFRTREVSAERPMVEVTIGNDGSVIMPEKLERLFKAFYTEGKRHGTGLGLVIAQGIVQAHGGTIICRSEPGLGTEFVFTLPVATGAPEAWAHGIAVLPTHTGALLRPAQHPVIPVDVVVDDDAFVREVWESTGDGTVEILTFSSPGDLLAAMDQGILDLQRLRRVITDYHFADDAGMNGIDLARAIRSRLHVPVVLASNGVFSAQETLIFDQVIEKGRPAGSAGLGFSGNMVQH